MKAIVTVKVTDLTSPTGGGCIPLDGTVLEDLVRSAIIDEGFEDVEVYVTVVPEDAEPEIIQGVDLHSATARKLFGEDYTPEERDEAKTRVFRALYGEGGE